MTAFSGRKNPTISVIMPAYNHEAYIPAAIASVLNQTFDDFELIIIDDGSTDNTFNNIKSVQDDRIRAFQQTNQGAAKTINRGISLARGRYLSVLNSDDLYKPGRLEKMAEFLDGHLDVALVSSLIEPIESTGQPVLPDSQHAYWLRWYDNAVKQFHRDDPITSLLRYNFVVSTSNIFVRSAIFKDERKFHEYLSYCHDYEFLLRALLHYPFHLLDDRLLMYRLHEANTIRENEFLKHLEFLYAIFNTLDMEVFFRKSLPERMNSSVFQGLSENPEMNPQIQLTKLSAILQEKDYKLFEADGWLKDQREQIQNQRIQLETADGWLKDQQAQIQRLETSDRLLHEIYSSKGWLWLTRYRKVKQKLTFPKKAK